MVNTEWIDIFRAGRYPQGEYTQSDLQSIVNTYDKNFLTAPVTKDHIDSGEKFGDIEELRVKGNSLQAKMLLNSDMVKDIAAGKFNYRSAEIYDNLDGKGKYLRGLTFLGAGTPAVKGQEKLKVNVFNDQNGIYQSHDYINMAEKPINFNDNGGIMKNKEEKVNISDSNTEKELKQDEIVTDVKKEETPELFTDKNKDKNTNNVEKEKEEESVLVRLFKDSLQSTDDTHKFTEALRKFENMYETMEAEKEVLLKEKEQYQIKFSQNEADGKIKKFMEDGKVMPTQSIYAKSLLTHSDNNVRENFEKFLAYNIKLDFFTEKTKMTVNNKFNGMLYDNNTPAEDIDTIIKQFIEENDIDKKEYGSIVKFTSEGKTTKQIINILKEGGK